MKMLRDALSRLVDGVWRGGDRSSRREVHASVRPCFTIPADVERDADLLLAAALTELKALREVANAAHAYYHEGTTPTNAIALGDALRAYDSFKPGRGNG